ncbi:MAG: class I SAM-dependent methyltransferase [Clostridia bacterium]|nr:class I SAM-dependent methyltransferase [Clostridia bacterium]
MKTNEHDYYSQLANWSFEDINYEVENFTNWIYEDEIIKHVTKNSKILDLGTAAGEKVLKRFPECAEILGTDFSEEMINAANKNLEKSGKKNIMFKVMNNLKMDTPDNYFDIVTARHTVTVPKQIYNTLKPGGYLIIRGVDKLDCWSLKRMFNRGQALHDNKPISLVDYEAVLDAGFKDVELIPLHVIEYYKTKEDLYALLLKTPILDDLSELKNNEEYERVPIEKDIFEQYVAENITEKGIKLIRRYYGIIAQK